MAKKDRKWLVIGSGDGDGVFLYDTKKECLNSFERSLEDEPEDAFTESEVYEIDIVKEHYVDVERVVKLLPMLGEGK